MNVDLSKMKATRYAIIDPFTKDKFDELVEAINKETGLIRDIIAEKLLFSYSKATESLVTIANVTSSNVTVFIDGGKNQKEHEIQFFDTTSMTLSLVDSRSTEPFILIDVQFRPIDLHLNALVMIDMLVRYSKYSFAKYRDTVECNIEVKIPQDVQDLITNH